ncbi:MAG: hypothetical protein DDT21_01350 [Syntrophomonadaceae bacterium]|nr:hypothetical protein [Bacillota bacterium]
MKGVHDAIFTKLSVKTYIVAKIHIERGEDLRTFRVVAICCRLLGFALAVAGIGLIASALPRFVWVFLLGAALIWLGWAMFRKKQIY